MRIIVLHGGEDFIIRERSRELARLLETAFGGCEQFNFDGATVELATVLDELRSYGLMQRHKLVILDNADKFLVEPQDEQQQRRRGHRQALEKYAASPVQEATLLLRASSWKVGNLDKAISKIGGAIIKCEPPSEEKAAAWCIARCSKRHGCALEPEAAALLVQRLGPHLGALDTELAKMAALVAGPPSPPESPAGPGREAASGEAPAPIITREVVAAMTQPSREEEAWSVQQSFLEGSAAALTKIRDLIEISRVDEVPLMWSAVDLMRKLHTAGVLLRRGENRFAVMKQARLWGAAGETVLAAAGQLEPRQAAHLLRLAIEADAAAKSGRDPRRCLEGLSVLVADEMK